MTEYFYALLITIASLFMIDIIIRYFGYKNNSHISLLIDLISCFSSNYKFINAGKIFIQRFLLLLFACIFVFLSIIFCFKIYLNNQKLNNLILFLCLIYTYIHALFYFISSNYIRIYYGNIFFRVRIMLSLSFISIIYLLNFIDNKLIYTSYYFLILLILSYLLLINSRVTINHKKNYSLVINEFGFSFVKLYYKIFNYLEIIFYAAIIINITNKEYFYVLPYNSFLLYLILLMIVSYLYYQFANNNHIYIHEFIKSKLLTLIFFIFGLSQLLQTIL